MGGNQAKNEVVADEFRRERPVWEELGYPPPPQPPAEYPNLTRQRFKVDRHVFVLFDGTWNEDRSKLGASVPTNVLKLLQDVVEADGGKPVVLRYYRGVGNHQDNGLLKRSFFGLSGLDEVKIRETALADFWMGHQRGDAVYVLGFSRGAASARLFAQDLNRGLPEMMKATYRHRSNKLTRHPEPRLVKLDPSSKQLRVESYKGMRVEIQLLGCWDTVDAFVLPNRDPNNGIRQRVFGHAKMALGKLVGRSPFSRDENRVPFNVRKAVHCVAIDETRNEFLPSLMWQDKGDDRIEEVWFPGVHSDVGGGYRNHGLSVASYAFMKDHLKEAARAVDRASIRFRSDSEEDADNVEPLCFHFHGLRRGLRRWGFGRSMRTLKVLGDCDRPVRVHESYFLTVGKEAVATSKNERIKWRFPYRPYNVAVLSDGEYQAWPKPCGP